MRTNVVGYKNRNTWPLFIAISEYNTSVHVMPKDYARDRDGQIINDPVLDNYVGHGMLTKEVGTKALPLLRIMAGPSNVPVTGHAGAPANPQQPTPGAMSPVRQAVGFTRDARGQTVAVVPKQTAFAQQPDESTNPVKSYTMEEAKKMRLVKPTIQVPESFGADENTGTPPHGRDIPYIKVARDAVRSDPGQLPREMRQEAASIQAAKMLNQQLDAATGVDMDSSSVLTDVSRVMRPAPQPAQPPPAPVPRSPIRQTRPAQSWASSDVPVAEPVEDDVKAEADAMLPPPQIETAEEPGGLGEPMMEEGNIQEPQAPEPEAENPSIPPRLRRTSKFICVACGQSFRMRSELFQHARAVPDHKDLVPEIMAQYPLAS